MHQLIVFLTGRASAAGILWCARRTVHITRIGHSQCQCAVSFKSEEQLRMRNPLFRNAIDETLLHRILPDDVAEEHGTKVAITEENSLNKLCATNSYFCASKNILSL